MFLEKFSLKQPRSPPFMEPLFYGSRSAQVKSINDWNNIIDKIHFTPEDSTKHFEVIKKPKYTILS